MPSFRRPDPGVPGPDSRPEPAQPAARAPAGPWSTAGLPLLPLTALASLAGVLLIVVLFLMNGSHDAPTTTNLATDSAVPSTSVAPGSAVPSPSEVASASASSSDGPTSAAIHIDTPAFPTPTDLAFGRSLGSPNAPVQLDVWEDFQCPACDAFTGSVEPYLVEKYIRPGTARLTFHDIATIGEESFGAAIGARCADRQGKFWPYHDLLFANQAPENSGTLTKDRSKAFAQAVGIDIVAFTACLEDPDVADAVIAETRQGLASGITETPTLLANGIKVSPATSSAAIDAAVATALKSGSASPSP